MKTLFLIIFLISTGNLYSQPTGNEKLVLDIFDIVNSDSLFISQKTHFIPMREEKKSFTVVEYGGSEISKSLKIMLTKQIMYF